MKYKKYATLLSATVLLSTALVACDDKEDVKTDTKVEKPKEVKKTKKQYEEEPEEVKIIKQELPFRYK